MGRTRTRIGAGVVLDTGALIALERGDKRMIALLHRALAQGQAFRVPAGVVGEAWRNGRVQVTLARFLRSEEVEIVPLDDQPAPFLRRTLRRRERFGCCRRVGRDSRQGAARPHSYERSW
jgi:hypothetical protein